MHASDMSSPCSSSFLINIPRFLGCFIHDCHIFMSWPAMLCRPSVHKNQRGAGIHLRRPSLRMSCFLLLNTFSETNIAPENGWLEY